MSIKKLGLMLGMGLFLAGCGAKAQQSEFWQHPSVYASWDHLKFSWCGYQNPTAETGKLSQEQKWWGIPIDWKAGK